MTIPNFHEVTDEQWNALKAEEPPLTWEDIKARYRQPDWCTYPGALDGMMGCWSLTGRKVTGEDFCRSCDCHKDFPTLKAKDGE